VDELNEFAEEEGPSKLDPKVLVLYGLGRSSFWVVLFTLIGLAGGLVAGAIEPNTYTSVGTLRLLSGERERVTREMASGGEDPTGGSVPINDEILMLRQEEIYNQAALQIGPLEVLAPSDPAQFDTAATSLPVSWLHKLQSRLFAAQSPKHVCAEEGCTNCTLAARRVLKNNTDIIPELRSTVITVMHTASSPEKAQKQNAVLLEWMVQRHADEYNVTSKFNLSEDKLASLQDNHFDALKDYDEHRDLCGFLPLGAEEAMKLQDKLEDRQADIDKITAERAQAEGEREAIAKRWEETPAEVERITPETKGPNPERVRQEQGRRDLELQRILLPPATFTDGATVNMKKDLIRIDGQIAALTESIEQLDPFAVMTPEFVEMVPNEVYLDMTEKIEKLDARDIGFARLLKGLKVAKEALEKKLDLVKQCQNLHGILERSIDQKRVSLENITERHRKLEILKDIETANLHVFEQPSLPLAKDGPQRTKRFLMGVFGGLFAGIGLAVLRQLLDGRVRYPETVEKGLELRVLAVVPEMRSLRRLPRNSSGGI